MSVISVEFLLFCGILLSVYYRVPERQQWGVLLICSYLFYGLTDPKNLIYILFTTLTTYGVGCKLGALHAQLGKKAAKQKGKPWLIGCLTANFGMLFGFKVNLLYGGLLPLGISFYTFQSMGYLIDVHRGTIPAERSLSRLALFVSYFPQLIQGPIRKYSESLFVQHPYDGKRVSFGFQRMLWGYFKKLVIGERAAVAVKALLGLDGAGLFLLSTLYAVQIYGDFTGGIDIALGLSEAMGISLPENFCRPFFSKSIAEFWRRWHISLGQWMKDYIFYPVSVSRPMRNLSKAARKRFPKFGKRLPVYMASLVTWFATGVWHGLTPNFILWGMMNCTVIILSEELSPLFGRLRWKEKRWYRAFAMGHTFILMNLIRVVDLFPNVGEYFRRMVAIAAVDLSKLGLSTLDWIILLVACLIAFAVSLFQERRGNVRDRLWQGNTLLRYGLTFGLFLAVLLMGQYGVGYDPGSFLYSQF